MVMALTGAGAYPAASVSLAPTYRTGDIQTASFGGSFTFPTSVTTYAGKKHIIMLSIYNYSGTLTMTLGGDAMTKLAGEIVTGTNAIFVYEVVPSSAGAGKDVVVTASGYVAARTAFDMWTTASSAAYSSAQTRAFGYAADPQITTADLTVPAGGFGLIQMYCGGSAVTGNSGCTEVAERASGGDRMWAAEMTATGRPSANAGDNVGSQILAVAYG